MFLRSLFRPCYWVLIYHSPGFPVLTPPSQKKSSVRTPGPLTSRPACRSTRGPTSTFTVPGPLSRSSVRSHGPRSTLTVPGPPSRSAVRPRGPRSTLTVLGPPSRSSVHAVTVRGPRVSDDTPGFGRLILVATAAAVAVAGVPVPGAGDGANLEVVRVGV